MFDRAPAQKKVVAAEPATQPLQRNVVAPVRDFAERAAGAEVEDRLDALAEARRSQSR